jgi:hypothetical protein
MLRWSRRVYVYLYYQKLPGVTEISLSSDGRTNFLNWKNKFHKKDADFILYTLKQISIQNRIMDEKTYIWSIFGPTGDIILAHFESFVSQGILKQVTMVEVTDDLQARLSAGRLDKPLRKQGVEEIKFKEEDFFYATPAQESGLSRDEVIQKLAVLIGLDETHIEYLQQEGELKSHYRRAALKYHPDRNNGDGSKMSELNMLWSIFNQGVSK